MTNTDPQAEERAVAHERLELLHTISRGLERPMIILGVVWLVLVLIDLTYGLSPILERLNWTIWGLFAVQFITEFAIAPRKLSYLKSNWITLLALIAPALRLLAIARVARASRAIRAARGARTLRMISSVNRGMRALGQILGRRGFGYAVALTTLVAVTAAAGVYAFEREAGSDRFDSYGYSLWWTAMTITTMGTDHFPVSAEGRLLSLLVATYGFAVFGYVTATIASFFVARDAESTGTAVTRSVPTDLEAIRVELTALRAAYAQLAERPT